MSDIVERLRDYKERFIFQGGSKYAHRIADEIENLRARVAELESNIKMLGRMELFKKTYNGESIVDVGRDVSEAFDSDYNAPAALIPQDEHGFQQGEFIVTIAWVPNACGGSALTAELATTVAYIDNEGSVIIVGYEAYRKTSWIDGDDRAIPASWKKLEVVDNA